MFLKWPFGGRCSAGSGAGWQTEKSFFVCEEMSCIGDFLYFCMRCLALISLPMRRASVCGFLHEANVGVDFSFSSLSLCDIVYWEKKQKLMIQMWTKKKSFYFIFYFKRGYCDTVCYCHSSWSSQRVVVFFSFFFSQKCQNVPILSYWLLKSFAFLFCTFPSFLWCLQKGVFMWHMQKLPSPWWYEEPC